MKKNRLVYVIIAIIIIAGIINTYLNKFAFSLAYDTSMKVDLYIGKDYDINEIKSIAKEAIGTKDILVQKVETFNDMVSITAREITEEQKNTVVTKINEKYEAELKAEETEIMSVPHYDGKDLLRRYIKPVIISAISVLIYLIIRYNKLGKIKTIARTITWSAVIELLYVSIISLARIPVSFYTIPLSIVIEIITLIVLANIFEKELEHKKKKNKKEFEEYSSEVEEEKE